MGVETIREHALGLADVASAAALDARVPTCPDWTLADLVWHLTEVEHFWTYVIEHRPTAPESYVEPERPPDLALVGGLTQAAAALATALDGVDASDRAWSWSDDHSVGFTLRRQSHEALVHHVDARLAAGVELPGIDAHLAADGVDEIIDVMLTGVPDWATFERRPGVVVLRTLDTGDEWTVGFGRMTGVSPESGRSYDLSALEPVDGSPDTVISGTAVDLDLWLWGRCELGELEVRGDVALAHELRAIAEH